MGATGTTVSSTLTPMEPVAPSPSSTGSQCCYYDGCSSFGSTTSCNPVGSWCSESEENCGQCAGTFCKALSPQRTCVPSGTGIWDNPSVWEPACTAAGTGGVCPEPMCKWSGGLLEVRGRVVGARSARRQHFLGAALIQASATIAATNDIAGALQGEL